MKILDSYWFTNTTMSGCIGVVKIEDDYEGIKYYIGLGQGFDSDTDSRRIAECGSTFPAQAGQELFNK
jgi:hypothetical protein